MTSTSRTFEERLDNYNSSVLPDVQAREAKVLATASSNRVSLAMESELKSHIADFERYHSFAQQGVEELHLHCTKEPENQWTPKMLSKKCGLLIDGQRVAQTTAQVAQENWPEVINMSMILNTMKNRPDMNAKQAKFLDEIQQKFRSVNFEKRDLRRIANALQLKLSEDIEHQTVTTDVTKHSEAVEKLTPDLANCEHLLHSAMQNGDMALAEDISNNQLTLLEKLLEVTEEQYPMLQSRKDQAKEFVRRRRWGIFRMANRDINGVIEMKTRQIETCQESIDSINQFLELKKTEDRQAKESFRTLMADSDAFLDGTANAQREAFAKLQKLQEEVRQTEEKLTNLGKSRAAEMKRRIEQCEEEATRVSDHTSLLKCASDTQGSLRIAVNNAEKVQQICSALNDFLLDGCDNITLKFEKSEATMNNLISNINQQYLKLFSEYAVCSGRLRYRKEQRRSQLQDSKKENQILLEFANDTLDAHAKKFADQRKDCEDRIAELTSTIDDLKDRLDTANRKFEHCAQSLSAQGVHFIHPMELSHKANWERKAKVTDFRAMMNVTENRVEEQISEDVKQVQSDFEDHKIALMRKQGATHRRHMDQSNTRAPKPPQSQTERFQAASFNRYQQLVKELNKRNDADEREGEEEGKSMTSSGAGPATRPMSSTGGSSSSVKTPAPPAKATTGPLPPKLEGETVVAIYSYKPRAADELAFSKGDSIICVNPGPEPGWFLGVCNQRSGLFPLNYVSARVDDKVTELD